MPRPAAVALAAVLAAGAVAQDAESAPTPSPVDRLVVLNKSEADVSVIDPQSGQTLSRLPVGVGPHEAATAGDGRTVVVCNYGERTPGSSMTVLDIAAGEVVRTIDLGEKWRPHGVQFVDERRVAVTAEVGQRLLLVDVIDGAVVAQVETAQRASHMVALAADRGRAFVANIASGSMSVIDLAKGELLANVVTGAGCEGIAVRPGNGEVWTGNRQANTLSVIDPTTLEEVAELACASFPIRVAFTHDGAHALVSCAMSGDLSVWDAAARREVRRVSMRDEDGGDDKPRHGRLFAGVDGPTPVGILIDPDGRRAYVANTNADQVAVVDLTAWKVVQRIATGAQPDGMAWCRFVPKRP